MGIEPRNLLITRADALTIELDALQQHALQQHALQLKALLSCTMHFFVQLVSQRQVIALSNMPSKQTMPASNLHLINVR